MPNNDFPNPHYVDPNPYTGEADGEAIDYAKLRLGKTIEALAPYIPDAERRRDAANEVIRAIS